MYYFVLTWLSCLINTIRHLN